MNKRKFYSDGFTLVELLIVIVIIGVLAGISVAAYSGVQKSARNTASLQELNQWKRLFEVYRAQNGQFPPQLTVGERYCLGKNFPKGAEGQERCRDYKSTSTGYLQASSDDLMTELQTVGSLPSGQHTPIRDVVGPYLSVGSSGIDFVGIFHGSVCPDSTRNVWTNSDNAVSLCASYVAI